VAAAAGTLLPALMPSKSAFTDAIWV
jgi:hypothetical protein